MDLETLLSGDNASFLDQQYSQWLESPGSVDPQWATLFESLDKPTNGKVPGSPPSFVPPSIFNPTGRGAPATQGQVMAAAQRQARVAQLINAYRVRGHTQAAIDPLERLDRGEHPELTLEYYGLTVDDLDVPVSGNPMYGVSEITTLRHITERLNKAYCGSFGIEFMNIGEPRKKKWLQERIETLQDRPSLTHDEELLVLEKLSDAEGFERMLHTKFPGTKRFSLEGGETFIPLMHLLLERFSEQGLNEVTIGMAHRGRLNFLANIMGKSPGTIVEEFQGSGMRVDGSGDVKYHLGHSTWWEGEDGHKVFLSLCFNPSHLEAVNPLVEGRVRARQMRRGEEHGHGAAAILVHGDAAFSGQGLVAEVLNLSDLEGYRTGGTIHIVINNQIGFTTSPTKGRSTPYCTDVARMLAVPIFHVNGEDPWAVADVVRLAAEYRRTFGQDVVIDMYCFRKHGHNEGDEPSFTQPLLYEAIRNHPTPRQAYARKMIERGDLTREEVDRVFGISQERLERSTGAEHEPAYAENVHSEMAKLWADFKGGSMHAPVESGVPRDRLQRLIVDANTVADDWNVHRKVSRLLAQRREVAEGARPVDWAVAEQLAYASLVTEGYSVRLSGQDSGRGTFSHRHAILNDIKTGEDWIPLQHLAPDQAPFYVYDSMLSEAGVLGFEYGYSLETPDGLCLWEAQFGDFANGAQVIIDNFIITGEQKWARNSGLVMLLPHGYEGQGPEHSSARLERFLQLCAQDNMFVANCTTPASFFHLLRRQVLLKVRKPLVVMSPKSLLRHAQCTSTLDDLASGTFRRVIPEVDDQIKDDNVKRVVFCSGKVYYDLYNERERRGIDSIALIRLEQLYPLPGAEIREQLEKYPGADVMWAQEEPRNMGAWPLMDEWFNDILGRMPTYAGRPRTASPATGSPKKHQKELEDLLEQVLTLSTQD